MSTAAPTILAIESSCDETSAAVLTGLAVRSNIIASQKVHEKYGGVVPELASRAHQSNIVPVVRQAMDEAGATWQDLDAVAFTQGPGLMGALLVGSSFAKSLAMSLHIPLLGVHHMQAHVLAHFADLAQGSTPEFPFLCLTVSGGHTQIVRVDGPLEMKVVGSTIDDAAGEAFDKAAKVLGLPYPGGPQVDRLAATGNAHAFRFTRPSVPGNDFSFSGLKTSLLYLLRDQEKTKPGFAAAHLADICASYQRTIVEYLLDVFFRVAREQSVAHVCLAGGVSANSELRNSFVQRADEAGMRPYVPPFAYCTDNAAMVGVAGYFLLESGKTCPLDATPQARMAF